MLTMTYHDSGHRCWQFLRHLAPVLPCWRLGRHLVLQRLAKDGQVLLASVADVPGESVETLRTPTPLAKVFQEWQR